VLLSDLHRVVSAVQLGITLASLALGSLGESTFAAMIRSVVPPMTDSRAILLVHAAALAIAFAMLSSCTSLSANCAQDGQPGARRTRGADDCAAIFVVPENV